MFSSNALIFTSTIVGIFTYITVFNLGNIVQCISSLYNPVREGLIFQMKQDNKDSWASKAKYFAAFRPRREGQKLSEWWILLFWLYCVIQSLRSLLPSRGRPSRTTGEPSPSLIVLECPDETSGEATETGTASKVIAQDSIKSLNTDPLLFASEKSSRGSVMSKIISFTSTIMRRGKWDNTKPSAHQGV